MTTRDILGQLAQAQGGRALGNIGARFGLSESQAQTAVQSLLPALSAGVRREGISGVASMLRSVSPQAAQRTLEDPTSLADTETTEQGNALLGTLLGSKTVSRRVAADAAERTGVSQSILQQMLPLVATMVTSQLAQNALSPAEAEPSSSGRGGLFGQMIGAVSSNSSMGDLLGAFGSGNDGEDDDGIAGDLLDLINQRGR